MMRRRILLVGLAVLVLVAVVAGRVVLRGAADGPVLRTVALGTTPWAATLDAQSGRLYVVNRSYGRFGFAGGNSFSIGGNGVTSRGGDPPNGDTVSMIDTRAGSLVRTVAVGPDPRAVALDSRRGLVYVSNDDDASVTVLDARSGALLHTTQVGARPHALVADASTNRVFVVNTTDSTVSVLDARQSKVLRVVHVPTAVDFSGAAVDTRTNRVFIAGGGSVSVLDARNGALLRTISLEEDRYQAAGMGLEITPMAVDDRTGRVFVLGPGIVRVLDAGTGRLLRSIPVSTNATALALDPRHGHLLLTTTGATDDSGTIRGPGSLQVLDSGSGKVLRTISLGATPSALVVDERANSVIVIDSGGQVQATNSLGWLPDGLRQRLPFLPAQKSTTRTEPGSVTVLDLSRL